ncbi:hypothetical protein SS50377_21638 [Spironucleus salmonicida]|uniref:Uncharacterized protein n=1 Tax=Spironucleus salmonicida TaxID=348837 RepID=V6LMB9_9EUKA|nr:hypothetical protein SS50377_21638 [Spironucleus salmonicida]|eukprot:EST45363.1 Hypothetical protein SS50377_14693 [Spironucleus salmonicida]
MLRVSRGFICAIRVTLNIRRSPAEHARLISAQIKQKKMLALVALLQSTEAKHRQLNVSVQMVLTISTVTMTAQNVAPVCLDINSSLINVKIAKMVILKLERSTSPPERSLGTSQAVLRWEL